MASHDRKTRVAPGITFAEPDNCPARLRQRLYISPYLQRRLQTAVHFTRHRIVCLNALVGFLIYPGVMGQIATGTQDNLEGEALSGIKIFVAAAELFGH